VCYYVHMNQYTKPPRKSPVSRTLHCIDAENLVGAPQVSAQQLQAIYEKYRNQVEIGPFDQTIVASSHFNALVVASAWPEGRHVWRSGKDGADLALIDSIKDQIEQAQFSKVIIASGDGIFGKLIYWLQNRGIEVIVIGRHGSISRTLTMQADCVNVLRVKKDADVGVEGKGKEN
jgi:uncharacterized LabA/DUF88 family protein